MPLPCRQLVEFTDKPSTDQGDITNNDKHPPSRHNLKHEHQTNSASDIPLRPQAILPATKQKDRQCDLDKLVIISNPNWPTSGVTKIAEPAKCGSVGKRPPSTLSAQNSESTPPQKRPKLNHNFGNLPRNTN